MANGIVPDEGLARECFRILVNADTEFQSWSLLLWTNDYTPVSSTVLGDLVEASFTGYSRRTLAAANWSAPTVLAGVATSENSPVQVWTNGDATDVTIFGVAYYDNMLAVLRLVQRFDDADIVAVSPGGTIAVTPRFTYRSQLASE